jgi:ligand-binding SRPBCC domain-containing protein
MSNNQNYIFEDTTFLPQPIEKVFAYFCDAHNLDTITPPWLNFEIKTPDPIEMQEGTELEYRIVLHGVPINWKTRITEWEPPFRFVDSQMSGPYQTWIHLHKFERVEGGTLMTDRVEYRPIGGILAPMVHKLFVRRDIERIFEYRKKTFTEMFNPEGLTLESAALATA